MLEFLYRRPVVAVIAACLPVMLIGLDHYPAPWLDEGFKLNSARLLAETGVFGSRSAAGVIEFDTTVTPGPFEAVLMAASFKVFGPGVVAGRLPSVASTVVAVVLVGWLGRAIWGDLAGALMALALVAAPPIGELSVVRVGRQALTEAPATVLAVVGLWMLWRSWTTGSFARAVAAGALFGMAILSKPQFAISLVPALVLVGLAWWLTLGAPLLNSLAPVGTALSVFGAWMLVGRLVVDADTHAATQNLLREGVAANFFTGQWGRTLSLRSIVGALVALAGAAYGARRVVASWRTRRLDAGTGVLAMLVLLAAGNTVWFTLLSVGWPRYGYLGLFAGLALLGLMVADLAEQASRRLAWTPAVRARQGGALILGFTLTAWIGHVPPALAVTDGRDPVGMTRVIDAQVPRHGIIETWEWELTSLGAHTNFHHPGQHLLNQAIADQGRGRPYDLDYDLLQADPDYLVTGPFSAMTGIYGDADIERHFERMTTVGRYALWKRRR